MSSVPAVDGKYVFSLIVTDDANLNPVALLFAGNANVSIQPVGPSVGPHLGPGCVGGVVLYATCSPVLAETSGVVSHALAARVVERLSAHLGVNPVPEDVDGKLTQVVGGTRFGEAVRTAYQRGSSAVAGPLRLLPPGMTATASSWSARERSGSTSRSSRASCRS